MSLKLIAVRLVFALTLVTGVALPAAAQLEIPDEVQGGFFAPGSGLGTPSTEDPEAADAGPSDSEMLVEGIAAQVGGGVVLVSEVRRLSAPIEARMRKANVPQAEIELMRTEALDRLIEQRLIEDVVRRAQLEATDAEVSAAIQSIANENGLTIEQMRQTIAGHGLTLEEYRDKIKSEIERNKVLGSMVRSKVNIEESEVRSLYAQRFGDQRDSGSEIHLRHLLIAVAAERMRNQAAACQIAGDIREKIVAGDISFENAAARLSDVNSERGGDLGWVHADELASWMEPAVNALQPGQLSDVIAMPFGCNLLMVVDRREFQPVSYEQARPALEQQLFGQKMEAEYMLWIEKLREQVYIERKGTYASSAGAKAGAGTAPAKR